MSIGPLFDAGVDAGIKAERKAVLDFLRGVPVEVIDDWGLNAIGNLIEIIEGGGHVQRTEPDHDAG